MTSPFAGIETQIETVVTQTLIPLVLSNAHQDVGELVKTVLREVEKVQKLTTEQKEALKAVFDGFQFHHSAYSDLLKGRFHFKTAMARTPVRAPIDLFEEGGAEEGGAAESEAPKAKPAAAPKTKAPRKTAPPKGTASSSSTDAVEKDEDKPKAPPKTKTTPKTKAPPKKEEDKPAIKPKAPPKPRAPRKTAEPKVEKSPEVVDEEDDEDGADTEPFPECSSMLTTGPCPYPALPGTDLCKRCTPAPRK